MRISILGSGNMGTALARRQAAATHQVALAARTPAKVASKGPGVAASDADAARGAEIVFLAVPYDEVKSIAGQVGSSVVVTGALSHARRQELRAELQIQRACDEGHGPEVGFTYAPAA